jgi:hypothetical protein
LRRFDLEQGDALQGLAGQLDIKKSRRGKLSEQHTKTASMTVDTESLPRFPKWIMVEIPSDKHWMLWGWWNRVKSGVCSSDVHAKFKKGDEGTFSPRTANLRHMKQKQFAKRQQRRKQKDNDDDSTIPPTSFKKGKTGRRLM